MQKLIDIYATEDGLNPFFDHYEYQRKYDGRVNSSDYGGRPTDLVRFVGRRVKTRIVWDVELPSEPYFFWCNHELKTPTIQEKADDCDPDKVLKNVAAQTGLTFTKKKRKVPVLVISSSE